MRLSQRQLHRSQWWTKGLPFLIHTHTHTQTQACTHTHTHTHIRYTRTFSLFFISYSFRTRITETKNLLSNNTNHLFTADGEIPPAPSVPILLVHRYPSNENLYKRKKNVPSRAKFRVEYPKERSYALLRKPARSENVNSSVSGWRIKWCTAVSVGELPHRGEASRDARGRDSR